MSRLIEQTIDRTGSWAATQRELSWSSRIACGGLLLVLYLGVGIFDHEIWAPAETAFAGVTWEMVNSGNLAVPEINGIPYLEKPPLAYALSWLVCTLAGHVSPGLVRLPAALAGLLCLALMFTTARRFYGESVAWVCTLLCATTLDFFAIMHRGAADGIALLFCFLCFALFSRNLTGERPADRLSTAWTRRDWLADAPLVLALAVSFFAKNFYTFLIVVPPITTFLLLTGQRVRLLRFGALTLVVLLALVVPWCLVLYERGGPAFLKVVFFDNALGRLLPIHDGGPLHAGALDDVYTIGRDHAPLWLPRVIAWTLLPWILIHLGALYSVMRTPRFGRWSLFLRVMLASIVLSVTLSSSQFIQYYLPLIFPVLLITGEFLQGAFAEGSRAARWQWRLIAVNLAAVAIAVAIAPVVIGLWPEHPLLKWLWAVLVLTMFASAVSFLRDGGNAARLIRASCNLGAVMGLLVLFAIPQFDSQKSWRPFFDEIRAYTTDRALWTTIVDDRRLPVMDFYLQRRLHLLEGPAQIALLLRSDEKVGVLMYRTEFVRLRDSLAGIELRTRRAPAGQDLLIYVFNH